VPTYKAKKDVVVAGCNGKGETVGPISFKSGSYSTTDEEEVALLDECATDASNPIGFAPKEKE
jgi:hypothetical protein